MTAPEARNRAKAERIGTRVLIPRSAVEAFVAQAVPRARLREVAS